MDKFVFIAYCVLHGVALLVICYIAIVLYKSKNKSRNKVHFYVARDRTGGLWLYLGKPFRGNNEFYCSHDKKVFCLTYNLSCFGLNEDDYANLEWEDEPVEVFLNLED